MLNFIESTTSVFLALMPKEGRKNKGQFFTSLSTARFMAGLFDFSQLPENISVLDPGAGTGILSAAIVERLNRSGNVRSIQLVCYETDEDVIPTLAKNLEYLSKHSGVKLTYEIQNEDYISSQASDFECLLDARKWQRKYDLVIANPPYLKIGKDSLAAQSMPSVVHGAPNLYFLFASMSLFNLKDGSEMVYIMPRSWTSGEYFKAFRSYLLSHGKILHIHLFDSRDKVFSKESVLQETIIIKVKKCGVPPATITVTTSRTDCDLDKTTSIELDYESVVSGANNYVFLTTSPQDIETITLVNRYTNTFPSIGIRMKTGIVVDFRQRDVLQAVPSQDSIPIFYSQHIKNGRVTHAPQGKVFEWMSTSRKGLIQTNKNYVFCKRFTAKEEVRRLQCGVYLAADYPEYSYIGTQNKINFVEKVDGMELSEAETYGIYALLNSSLFDSYYRILNGSTQVNSTEVNNIPVPDMDRISAIGQMVMHMNDLSTSACDQALKEIAYV